MNGREDIYRPSGHRDVFNVQITLTSPDVQGCKEDLSSLGGGISMLRSKEHDVRFTSLQACYVAKAVAKKNK